MTITAREIAEWTPETNNKPSIELVHGLYLEYVNQYLTPKLWGEAHHMDVTSASVFLHRARFMHGYFCETLKAAQTATNPHR